MTTWQQIDKERFIIRSKGKVITVDTIRGLFAYSIALGLEFPDIEYAVLEMERQGHDYAEFGIWGSLIYTKRMTDEKFH
jgi:hypothetical protein